MKLKILHLEDNAIKQFNIARQLPGNDITHVTNLEDGLKLLPGDFNLIITDMWYPRTPGGKDNRSGEELIEYVSKNQINIPVILISNQDYRFPIHKNIHYSDETDWERELREAVSKIK